MSVPARRAWARAAAEQAARLAADAAVLLEQGSAGSAYGLATLALEEAGKALICLDPEAFLGDAIDQSDVVAKLRKHEVKLDAALSPFTLMAHLVSLASGLVRRTTLDMSAVEGWPGQLHRSRLEAMYVDYELGGAVRSPSNFPIDDARRAVEMATGMTHAFLPNLINAVLPAELPGENVRDRR